MTDVIEFIEDHAASEPAEDDDMSPAEVFQASVDVACPVCGRKVDGPHFDRVGRPCAKARRQ